MTTIYVLGAGTPTPTPDRYGTSFVVRTGNDYIMFDCGPAATSRLVKVGLLPTQIDHVFFTHHHFDHNVDYPCFLLTRWDQSIGGEAQLKVLGPPPTSTFTDRLLNEDYGAFSHDWLARVNSPASQQVHVDRGGTLPREPPSVDAIDIESGYIHEGGEWTVTAGLAEHVQPYLDSLAYRLDTPDGSIVFTGDTEPCESVTRLADGADMLVSMCADHEEMRQRTKAFVGACGTEGAARMARDAGVKRLVLSHMGPNLSQQSELERGLDDISQIYDGNVTVPNELTAIDL